MHNAIVCFRIARVKVVCHNRCGFLCGKNRSRNLCGDWRKSQEEEISNPTLSQKACQSQGMPYKTPKRSDRAGHRPTVPIYFIGPFVVVRSLRPAPPTFKDDICLSVNCDSLRLPTAKPEGTPPLPLGLNQPWDGRLRMIQSSVRLKNKQPCMHGLEDGRCHSLSVRNEDY